MRTVPIKTLFHRLACQQAEQTDHVQQTQAHREAAVFHLHGALLAFYRNWYAITV